MGSKGARYIVLPLYVVNIGILYSLLLTSGLILAWCTIYRHEESIMQLKEILKNKQTGKKLDFTAIGGKGDDGLLDEEVYGDIRKLPLEADESSQRSRRHLDSSQVVKKAGSHQHLKGQKGEKGDEGRKGRRGKKGFPGPKGLPGEKGERGETGKDGRDGRDGIALPGQPGRRGEKGDTGPRGFPGSAGSQGSPGIPGAQGKKGSDGAIGPKGETGQKGNKGDVGNTGKTGIKGDKGEHGIKGSKGDRGREGQAVMYAESAHIVGSGGKIKSTPGTKMIHPTVSWKPKHLSGSMTFQGGYIRVGVDGFYSIYGQMFYYDGTSAHMGYNIYIDNRKVLKAVYSVPSDRKKYHTQYTSGIFKILKGQKISVGTPFTKYYYFNESLSFFGAFMLHR